MNRILLDTGELGDDGVAVLDGRRALHVEAVLGCRSGDTVRIGLVDGLRGSAEVLSIGGGMVRLRCRLDAPAMSPSGLSLLLALPRPKVMRRLWAPLASLGVERIVLTNAAKVERHYFDTHWLEPAVYRPLLIEGLEQSGVISCRCFIDDLSVNQSALPCAVGLLFAFRRYGPSIG